MKKTIVRNRKMMPPDSDVRSAKAKTVFVKGAVPSAPQANIPDEEELRARCARILRNNEANPERGFSRAMTFARANGIGAVPRDMLVGVYAPKAALFPEDAQSARV